MMDIKGIQDMLPHRYPFLLIDKIIEVEPGRRATGIKNVTINEPFFQGHFPGHPIMPGVLIIEAMAQVGGVLALKSHEDVVKGKLIYFTGIDKARFRKPVLPGDQLRIVIEVINHKNDMWKMKAGAFVEEKLVCEAELMAAVVDKSQ